jgi:predicted RNA-binding protein with RPS1 domain
MVNICVKFVANIAISDGSEGIILFGQFKSLYVARISDILDIPSKQKETTNQTNFFASSEYRPFF